MNAEAETVYERIAKLEDEVGLLRAEVDILKKALRNKIVRYEISLIKDGRETISIID